MPLSKISINRTIVAAVLIVITCLLGFTGCKHIIGEERVRVDLPYIRVVTQCSGYSINASEKEITEPLEKKLSGILSVKSLHSASWIGGSHIVVRFEHDADLIEAINEVRDSISSFQKTLPSGCEPPTIDTTDAKWPLKEMK